MLGAGGTASTSLVSAGGQGCQQTDKSRFLVRPMSHHAHLGRIPSPPGCCRRGGGGRRRLLGEAAGGERRQSQEGLRGAKTHRVSAGVPHPRDFAGAMAGSPNEPGPTRLVGVQAVGSRGGRRGCAPHGSWGPPGQAACKGSPREGGRAASTNLPAPTARSRKRPGDRNCESWWRVKRAAEKTH